MWPAWYLETSDALGTVYVLPGDMPKIIEREGKRGQAWRFRKEWTTYRPRKGRLFKTLNRLKPKDEEDFWHIMGSCKDAGIKPPTSFVDCFLEVCPMNLIQRKHARFAMDGASFGGWQTVFRQRPYYGRVYKYDLNKAYRWSACQGLPDMRTAYYLTGYGDEPLAVYDAELPYGSIPYWPKKMIRGYVTSEELDHFRVIPTRVFGGLGFVEMLDFRQTFAAIDQRFPYCRDRISRAFWGLWNATEGPEQCSWKSGENVRAMQNPYYNPIWALYVTSRVKQRIADVRSLAMHCQVDAVLSIEPLPVGDAPGEWRLTGEYESYQGVWIGPKEEERISLAKGGQHG